jgi:hypothetical protein
MLSPLSQTRFFYLIHSTPSDKNRSKPNYWNERMQMASELRCYLLAIDRSALFFLLGFLLGLVSIGCRERAREEGPPRVSGFHLSAARRRSMCCKRTAPARYAAPFWLFPQTRTMDVSSSGSCCISTRPSLTMGDVHNLLGAPTPSEPGSLACPCTYKLQYLALVTRQRTWARARAEG